jgi:hypothetical protein
MSDLDLAPVLGTNAADNTSYTTVKNNIQTLVAKLYGDNSSDADQVDGSGNATTGKYKEKFQAESTG